MSTLKRFEEIEAWRQARELTRSVYCCSSSSVFNQDHALKRQMRRAAVSVMANIAEGFERGGTNEFSQFLAIAKGSAGEVQAHLYVAFDQGYIGQAEFEALLQKARVTNKLIAGFMDYLRSTKMKGQKFKPAGSTATRNQKPETRN